MSSFKDNVSFTAVMVVATTLAVVSLLMVTDRVRRRDRTAFCAEQAAEPEPVQLTVPPAASMRAGAPRSSDGGGVGGKIYISPDATPRRNP